MRHSQSIPELPETSSNIMRNRIVHLLPLLWITASGCAHFAQIPMWSSTTKPIHGVNTVAVLPFEGEWGTRVSEEVSDAFSASGAYTIVGIDSLPMTDSTAERGEEALALEQVLIAARQADIDAVMTGTIVSEEIEPLPSDKRSGWGFSPKSPPVHNSMTVDYRLIDTRTGETLTQNRIICHGPESLTPSEGSPNSLIQRCGLEVVSGLTPQCENCSMALANCRWTVQGALSVRRGVRAAERDDWDSAVTHWQAALKANPQNDAAIFNLALAAASQSDFVKAEELALEAIRIQHSDCYETGLEQIRKQRSQSDNASPPRELIKLSAID